MTLVFGCQLSLPENAVSQYIKQRLGMLQYKALGSITFGYSFFFLFLVNNELIYM